jgi:hypothetical protein
VLVVGAMKQEARGAKTRPTAGRAPRTCSATTAAKVAEGAASSGGGGGALLLSFHIPQSAQSAPRHCVGAEATFSEAAGQQLGERRRQTRHRPAAAALAAGTGRPCHTSGSPARRGPARRSTAPARPRAPSTPGRRPPAAMPAALPGSGRGCPSPSSGRRCCTSSSSTR